MAKPKQNKLLSSLSVASQQAASTRQTDQTPGLETDGGKYASISVRPSVADLATLTDANVLLARSGTRTINTSAIYRAALALLDLESPKFLKAYEEARKHNPASNEIPKVLHLPEDLQAKIHQAVEKIADSDPESYSRNGQPALNSTVVRVSMQLLDPHNPQFLPTYQKYSNISKRHG